MQKAPPANNGRKVVRSLKKSNFKSASSKAEAIDQVFNDNDEEDKQDFQKINRPENNNGNGKNAIYKQIIFVLLVIIICLGVYLFVNRGNEIEFAKNESGQNLWYLVKLTNGEFYYGQIKDTGADPVVLKNVYYNYDQINSEQNVAGEKKESENLILVKRAQEIHGIDNSMNIVRTQVFSMEILLENNKALKAILDHEK
ncbi:hypothetical protein KAI65_02405 [Candidatus Parcubacteria bacterium]|nr:hypothetical protein [Candidatus Parcubacteria bacterium]